MIKYNSHSRGKYVRNLHLYLFNIYMYKSRQLIRERSRFVSFNFDEFDKCCDIIFLIVTSKTSQYNSQVFARKMTLKVFFVLICRIVKLYRFSERS